MSWAVRSQTQRERLATGRLAPLATGGHACEGMRLDRQTVPGVGYPKASQARAVPELTSQVTCPHIRARVVAVPHGSSSRREVGGLLPVEPLFLRETRSSLATGVGVPGWLR